MHMIEKVNDDNYTFVICNMGAGVNYHPATIEQYPKDKFRTSIPIFNIKAKQFLDQAWWLLFFFSIHYFSYFMCNSSTLM